MRAARRSALVGLLILAVASSGVAVAHAAPSDGAQRASYAAPTAAIDIGELFGNENEPDENEPEEGGAEGNRSAESGGASGVSLPVVAVLVVLAGALGGFVYLRIRRLYLRLRAWGRSMWARL
jgi:hypothetical protein